MVKSTVMEQWPMPMAAAIVAVLQMTAVRVRKAHFSLLMVANIMAIGIRVRCTAMGFYYTHDDLYTGSWRDGNGMDMVF